MISKTDIENNLQRLAGNVALEKYVTNCIELAMNLVKKGQLKEATYHLEAARDALREAEEGK
jgi:hypothetical protein